MLEYSANSEVVGDPQTFGGCIIYMLPSSGKICTFAPNLVAKDRQFHSVATPLLPQNSRSQLQEAYTAKRASIHHPPSTHHPQHLICHEEDSICIAHLNLADRARGLVANSVAVAIIGFLVNTLRLASSRRVCLTIRSSKL